MIHVHELVSKESFELAYSIYLAIKKIQGKISLFMTRSENNALVTNHFKYL